jgi:hypothetical protein
MLVKVVPRLGPGQHTVGTGRCLQMSDRRCRATVACTLCLWVLRWRLVSCAVSELSHERQDSAISLDLREPC